VQELARAGCDVSLHYRHSRADAEQVATEVMEMGRRAITVQGELKDPDSWPAIIDQTTDGLGGLDVLVNNASVFLVERPDTLDAFDHGQWESIFRVNLVAPMALSHHARHHLEKNGRGRIVNVCDIAAEHPWPSHLAYSASKAALVALTKGLARALAPAIRVNGVSPGIAVFPDDYPDRLRRELVSRVPLGREGTPEEVARLVRFLAEDGGYITGQIVAIDGGRSLV
jgi:pteridine reductase